MVTTENKNNVLTLRTHSTSISITKNTWKKHKPRVRSDYYVRDTKLVGYYIRIKPNGKKTYVCQSRLGGTGRKVSISIGDCEIYSEAEARGIATENLKLIKQGIDPRKKIKEVTGKNKTLLNLAEEYINVNKTLAESTKEDYPKRIRNCMPSLATKPVIELDTDDVEDWWSKCSGSRNYQIAFSYARKLCKRAMSKGYIKKNVFAEAKELIGDFPEPNLKTTHIPQTSMWEFGNALCKVGENLHPSMRDLIVFLLVTGKRLTESMTLKWSDVDFKLGTITLERTKSGKVDVIPMTKFLYIMLKYRHSMRHKEKIGLNKHPIWVFPNRVGTGHIKDVRKSMKKLNAEFNIGWELTPHDFRRTFATACKEIELPVDEIAVLLNHARRDVTEGYIVRTRKEKTNNLEQVHDYLNMNMNQALGYITVNWHEAREEMFSPEFASEQPPAETNFDETHAYLLAKNEGKGLVHIEHKDKETE